MSTPPLFVHHLDLGPALTKEQQLQRLSFSPDSEAVLALLQYLRDEAAVYETAAHDNTAAGDTAAGNQAQGAAQAFRYAVMELYAALKASPSEDKESDSEDGMDLSQV